MLRNAFIHDNFMLNNKTAVRFVSQLCEKYAYL